MNRKIKNASDNPKEKIGVLDKNKKNRGRVHFHVNWRGLGIK